MVTLPLQGRVADCLRGMGCINGRVRGCLVSGFYGQIGGEREGE